MKITINCRFLSQPVTGVQRFAGQISRALKKTLPHAEFIAPRKILDTNTAEFLGVKVVGRLHGHLWEQIEVPFHLYRAGSPLLINLANTAPILYRNQISTLHDITFVRYPETFSPSFRMAYRLMTPYTVRNCLALVTVSEFSKKEISTYYGIDSERIHVVPNAANSHLAVSAGPPLDRKYLLAVSSPAYHKNFAAVISAYREWQHRDHIDLNIVGDIGSGLHQQAYSNLPAGVNFLGRVSDEQLAHLYTNAVGFIFPSLYEGFGIPPLEAQSFGCPVIASNAASMPEVLGSSAYYFNPHDTSELIEAMDALLCESRRTVWIQAGADNAARYDWEKSARQMVNLINGL